MSIFLYRLKNFICALLAVAFSVLIVCFLWAASVSRFSDLEGEHIFYLHSASSQGLRVETLRLCDFSEIRGESVRFKLEDGVEGEQLANELAKRYGARILFTENVCGTVSYYGYTPQWSDGISVNGCKINLHIAMNENAGTCVVGSPIVFDGY